MKINIYDYDEEELDELPIKQKIAVKKKVKTKLDENPKEEDNYEKEPKKENKCSTSIREF